MPCCAVPPCVLFTDRTTAGPVGDENGMGARGGGGARTWHPSDMASGSTGRRGAEPFEPPGVTWSPVSPRLALARRVVSSLVLGLPAVVFLLLAVAGGMRWAYVPGAVIGALYAWAFALTGRRTRAIGYAEREEELLVRKGVLSRSIVVVPYGRMQYVDVQAGPFERLFGIASVQLHTASAGTDASIPGLRPDEAARLRDSLTARGQSRLAGL